MAKIFSSQGHVADTVTLLVSDNEPVKFDVDLEGDLVHFEVLFDPKPNPENTEIKLKWENKDGLIKFVFFEWNNGLGTTTTDPMNFLGAKSDGSPIFFQLMHHKAGILNKLVLQFILGIPGEPIRVVRQ